MIAEDTCIILVICMGLYVSKWGYEFLVLIRIIMVNLLVQRKTIYISMIEESK